MTALHLCRVTVQTYLKDESVAADLALPNGVELGEVLPSVVDIVGGNVEASAAAERWTLARFDGSALDESKTLHDNGVRDGDLLILSTDDTQMPLAVADDLCHAAVHASASSCEGRLSRRMGAVACLWAAGFGAMTLASSGNAPVGSRVAIAAIVAVAATAGSTVAGRIAPEPLPALALGMTAVVFAAVAGFLAVPGGPAPPNFLLAAVVCSAVSIVLIHLASPAATSFTALATFSATVAVAAAVMTIWPAPAAAVGAMLAAASLAMLGRAAKLSIILTGLSPTMPGTADELGDNMSADTRVALAERGHQTLTGLLTGFSASAALGTALVAANHRDESALSGVGLTAVIATALLLRARQQRGTLRSIAVLSAGMISATATFTLALFWLPQHAPWLCMTAAVLGVGVLWLTVVSPGRRFSPVVRRSVELLEYLALGLVVPMACWVAGVFGIVRGLSLQ